MIDLDRHAIFLRGDVAQFGGDLRIHLFEGTLGLGVRIQTKLAPQLDAVAIDANQFDVALLNLAVNARDAMDGSGVLTIQTSNVSGDANGASETRDALVCITISDTGCGMSKETLAQVFEPFFTTKGEGQGTGLGLSQVYGFVHQSEGQVRIDSEIGKGTSVHLLLPARTDFAATDGSKPGLLRPS
ncbi:MAG: hypothetical protein JSR79_00180 [Proteobacteria bacterium]|nr:hypothetical protein [Pseudomonadota bacterium]